MELIKVKWIDSACSNSWWTMADDAEEKDKISPIVINSVGYIIKENDDYVCLAQNYGVEPEQFCNVITIPKGCIKEINVL